MPTRSKRQWRWLFKNRPEQARRWAHETPGGYKKLPETAASLAQQLASCSASGVALIAESPRRSKGAIIARLVPLIGKEVLFVNRSGRPIIGVLRVTRYGPGRPPVYEIYTSNKSHFSFDPAWVRYVHGKIISLMDPPAEVSLTASLSAGVRSADGQGCPAGPSGYQGSKKNPHELAMRGTTAAQALTLGFDVGTMRMALSGKWGGPKSHTVRIFDDKRDYTVDVRKLAKIVAGRKPVTVPIRKLQAVGHGLKRDPKRVAAADTRYPVLVRGNVMIDGRHRVVKLLGQGEKHVQAIKVSKADLTKALVAGKAMSAVSLRLPRGERRLLRVTWRVPGPVGQLAERDRRVAVELAGGVASVVIGILRHDPRNHVRAVFADGKFGVEMHTSSGPNTVRAVLEQGHYYFDNWRSLPGAPAGVQRIRPEFTIKVLRSEDDDDPPDFGPGGPSGPGSWPQPPAPRGPSGIKMPRKTTVGASAALDMLGQQYEAVFHFEDESMRHEFMSAVKPMAGVGTTTIYRAERVGAHQVKVIFENAMTYRHLVKLAESYGGAIDAKPRKVRSLWQRGSSRKGPPGGMYRGASLSSDTDQVRRYEGNGFRMFLKWLPNAMADAGITKSVHLIRQGEDMVEVHAPPGSAGDPQRLTRFWLLVENIAKRVGVQPQGYTHPRLHKVRTSAVITPAGHSATKVGPKRMDRVNVYFPQSAQGIHPIIDAFTKEIESLGGQVERVKGMNTPRAGIGMVYLVEVLTEPGSPASRRVKEFLIQRGLKSTPRSEALGKFKGHYKYLASMSLARKMAACAPTSQKRGFAMSNKKHWVQSDVVVKPLTRPSKIHGKGQFASRPIKAGQLIQFASTGYNHSDTPNCDKLKDRIGFVRAKRDIAAGEELTLNYAQHVDDRWKPKFGFAMLGQDTDTVRHYEGNGWSMFQKWLRGVNQHGVQNVPTIRTDTNVVQVSAPMGIAADRDRAVRFWAVVENIAQRTGVVEVGPQYGPRRKKVPVSTVEIAPPGMGRTRHLQSIVKGPAPDFANYKYGQSPYMKTEAEARARFRQHMRYDKREKEEAAVMLKHMGGPVSVYLPAGSDAGRILKAELEARGFLVRGPKIMTDYRKYQGGPVRQLWIYGNPREVIAFLQSRGLGRKTTGYEDFRRRGTYEYVASLSAALGARGELAARIVSKLHREAYGGELNVDAFHPHTGVLIGNAHFTLSDKDRTLYPMSVQVQHAYQRMGVASDIYREAAKYGRVLHSDIQTDAGKKFRKGSGLSTGLAQQLAACGVRR